MSVPVKNFYVMFFRDENGSANMNVDGSVERVPFGFQVPQGFTFHLHSFLLTMIAPAPLNPSGFAHSRFPLENGIFFTYQEPGQPEFGVPNGLEADLEARIFYNADFGNYVGFRVSMNGTMMIVQWDANDLTTGRPLLATSGSWFRMYQSDDLSNLVRFQMSTTGVLLDEAANATEALKDIYPIK
jgi:hypothetical protein